MKQIRITINLPEEKGSNGSGIYTEYTLIEKESRIEEILKNKGISSHLLKDIIGYLIVSIIEDVQNHNNSK